MEVCLEGLLGISPLSERQIAWAVNLWAALSASPLAHSGSSGRGDDGHRDGQRPAEPGRLAARGVLPPSSQQAADSTGKTAETAETAPESAASAATPRTAPADRSRALLGVFAQVVRILLRDCARCPLCSTAVPDLLPTWTELVAVADLLAPEAAASSWASGVFGVREGPPCSCGSDDAGVLGETSGQAGKRLRRTSLLLLGRLVRDDIPGPRPSTQLVLDDGTGRIPVVLADPSPELLGKLVLVHAWTHVARAETLSQEVETAIACWAPTEDVRRQAAAAVASNYLELRANGISSMALEATSSLGAPADAAPTVVPDSAEPPSKRPRPPTLTTVTGYVVAVGPVTTTTSTAGSDALDLFLVQVLTSQTVAGFEEVHFTPSTPASCALFASQPSSASSQASGVAFSLTKVHILFRGADLLAYHSLLQRDVEYTFTDLAHRTQLATVRANGEPVKVAVLSASGGGRTRILTATAPPLTEPQTPAGFRTVPLFEGGDPEAIIALTQPTPGAFVTPRRNLAHCRRLAEKEHRRNLHEEIVSYEGVLTAYLGHCVFELDGRARLFLSHLGADDFGRAWRVGARVALADVHLVHLHGELQGFGCCARSGVRIVEFAPTNAPTLLYPGYLWHRMALTGFLSIPDLAWAHELEATLHTVLDGIVSPRSVLVDAGHVPATHDGGRASAWSADFGIVPFFMRLLECHPQWRNPWLELTSHEDDCTSGVSCWTRPSPPYTLLTMSAFYSLFRAQRNAIGALARRAVVQTRQDGTYPFQSICVTHRKAREFAGGQALVLVGRLHVSEQTGRLVFGDATGTMDAVVDGLEIHHLGHVMRLCAFTVRFETGGDVTRRAASLPWRQYLHADARDFECLLVLPPALPRSISSKPLAKTGKLARKLAASFVACERDVVFFFVRRCGVPLANGTVELDVLLANGASRLDTTSSGGGPVERVSRGPVFNCCARSVLHDACLEEEDADVDAAVGGANMATPGRAQGSLAGARVTLEGHAMLAVAPGLQPGRCYALVSPEWTNGSLTGGTWISVRFTNAAEDEAFPDEATMLSFGPRPRTMRTCLAGPCSFLVPVPVSVPAAAVALLRRSATALPQSLASILAWDVTAATARTRGEAIVEPFRGVVVTREVVLDAKNDTGTVTLCLKDTSGPSTTKLYLKTAAAADRFMAGLVPGSLVQVEWATRHVSQRNAVYFSVNVTGVGSVRLLETMAPVVRGSASNQRTVLELQSPGRSLHNLPTADIISFSSPERSRHNVVRVHCSIFEFQFLRLVTKCSSCGHVGQPSGTPCIGRCVNGARTIQWELSALIDDGTGQARAMADGDVARLILRPSDSDAVALNALATRHGSVELNMFERNSWTATQRTMEKIVLQCAWDRDVVLFCRHYQRGGSMDLPNVDVPLGSNVRAIGTRGGFVSRALRLGGQRFETLSRPTVRLIVDHVEEIESVSEVWRLLGALRAT